MRRRCSGARAGAAAPRKDPVPPGFGRRSWVAYRSLSGGRGGDTAEGPAIARPRHALRAAFRDSLGFIAPLFFHNLAEIRGDGSRGFEKTVSGLPPHPRISSFGHAYSERNGVVSLSGSPRDSDRPYGSCMTPGLGPPCLTSE